MKRIFITSAIALLTLFAIGGCRILDHHKRSKEVVLLQSVWTMRRAIDFYVGDKGKRPQSLDELVSAGYLREIPADPFTGSNQTWIIEREKEPSVPSTQPGIIDARSAATGADKNGKPYNEY
ncbi:MAG: hypothetical protein MOB07_14895 [Acidobacteria bacterium]|nr:hypothetical protein [Acidobacteriota bacterium]